MGQREQLNAYLKAVRHKPFVWGQHDCLIFTNDAFRAMYGDGWADDWLGRYMVDGRVMRRRELIAEFKSSNFTKALDEKLTRIDHVPPLGSLVTTKQAQRWITGVAMGICTGSKAVFLSKEGVLYLPLDAIEQAWIRA
jgi:hypothetical protein